MRVPQCLAAALLSLSAAALACTDDAFDNISGFGPASGCVPTGYFQAQDLGNTNPSDLQTRCQSQCVTYGLSCAGFVGQLNKAADSGLYSGSCFYYGQASLPNAPHSCADKPSQLVAMAKDSSLRCFHRSAAAATAFCRSFISVGTVTSYTSSTTLPAITLTRKQTITESSLKQESTTTVSLATVTTTATSIITSISILSESTTATIYQRRKIRRANTVPTPQCIDKATPNSRLSSACSCLHISPSTVNRVLTVSGATRIATSTQTTLSVSTSTATITSLSTTKGRTTSLSTTVTTSTILSTCFETITTYTRPGPTIYSTITSTITLASTSSSTTTSTSLASITSTTVTSETSTSTVLSTTSTTSSTTATESSTSVSTVYTYLSTVTAYTSTSTSIDSSTVSTSATPGVEPGKLRARAVSACIGSTTVTLTVIARETYSTVTSTVTSYSTVTAVFTSLTTSTSSLASSVTSSLTVTITSVSTVSTTTSATVSSLTSTTTTATASASTVSAVATQVCSQALQDPYFDAGPPESSAWDYGLGSIYCAGSYPFPGCIVGYIAASSQGNQISLKQMISQDNPPSCSDLTYTLQFYGSSDNANCELTVTVTSLAGIQCTGYTNFYGPSFVPFTMTCKFGELDAPAFFSLVNSDSTSCVSQFFAVGAVTLTPISRTV